MVSPFAAYARTGLSRSTFYCTPYNLRAAHRWPRFGRPGRAADRLGSPSPRAALRLRLRWPWAKFGRPCRPASSRQRGVRANLTQRHRGTESGGDRGTAAASSEYSVPGTPCVLPKRLRVLAHGIGCRRPVPASGCGSRRTTGTRHSSRKYQVLSTVGRTLNAAGNFALAGLVSSSQPVPMPLAWAAEGRPVGPAIADGQRTRANGRHSRAGDTSARSASEGNRRRL